MWTHRRYDVITTQGVYPTIDPEAEPEPFHQSSDESSGDDNDSEEEDDEAPPAKRVFLRRNIFLSTHLCFEDIDTREERRIFDQFAAFRKVFEDLNKKFDQALVPTDQQIQFTPAFNERS